MENKKNEGKIVSIIKELPWYKKLEILRIAHNWTMEQAAEKCGTSKRIYWNWENGVCIPIRNNRKFIAKAFDVPANEIFHELSENTAV